MSSYTKLPKSDESTSVNLPVIQENLKNFQSKLKEYSRLPNSSKAQCSKEVNKICVIIDKELSKPRRTADEKSRLDVVEKNYSELKKNFLAVSSQERYEDRSESDDFMDKIEERKSFAFTHEELQEGDYLKQKKQIEDLQKDMLTVNEMFKDTAKMIGEQEEMLVEVDKDVSNAAGQTGKAVGELNKAEGYQKSAKKKLWIIMIIAIVVVAVVVGIVLGVGKVF